MSESHKYKERHSKILGRVEAIDQFLAEFDKGEELMLK